MDYETMRELLGRYLDALKQVDEFKNRYEREEAEARALRAAALADDIDAGNVYLATHFKWTLPRVEKCDAALIVAALRAYANQAPSGENTYLPDSHSGVVVGNSAAVWDTRSLGAKAPRQADLREAIAKVIDPGAFVDNPAMVGRERRAQADALAECAALRAKNEKLREALWAILSEETVTVHVGYGEGPGGGDYLYAEAVRTDSDAFGKGRLAVEALKEATHE